MTDNPKAAKFIVFSIAGYRFALPIHQVLRVVNYPAQIDCSLDAAGFIQLGRHLVKVLDLHSSLSPNSSAQSQPYPLFLLILPSPHGELYGIPVDRPPDVMECTAAQLQRLPQSHAASHAIERISYAVLTSVKGINPTLFLLDLQHLLSSSSIVTNPPAPQSAHHLAQNKKQGA